MRNLFNRIALAVRGDEGMSTAEYAVGTIAAVAFATTLYGVVTGDSVKESLTRLVERGLKGGDI